MVEWDSESGGTEGVKGGGGFYFVRAEITSRIIAKFSANEKRKKEKKKTHRKTEGK